jgi:maltose alpha-D-glucosyltransferase/alpha-amylase
MLRSFNYAAGSAIAGLGAERPDQVEDVESSARRFERRIRGSFSEGYVEDERNTALYPEDKRQARRLIELFSLERALHETRHELNNRPTWVSIPIKGIIDRTESRRRSSMG